MALRLPWHWRGLGIPLLLPVLLWQPARVEPGQFELLAADVGQGNAVLVRTASHSLLYDTGPRFSGDSDAGSRVLVPLLRALGERLDVLMLSHRDLDHTGGAPAVLAMLAHWILEFSVGWLFAALWNVALLYTTLGFRQFSHHFTGIRDALNDGDEPLARKLLAEWQQVEINDLPRNEIVRHVIEHSILSAHRHVFGVFFSYALLSVIGLGPVGAVVYRISEFAKRYSASAASLSNNSAAIDATVCSTSRLAIVCSINF